MITHYQCSWCKQSKVNSSDQWSDVPIPIEAINQKTVSHGICGKCLEREQAKRRAKDGKCESGLFPEV